MERIRIYKYNIVRFCDDFFFVNGYISGTFFNQDNFKFFMQLRECKVILLDRYENFAIGIFSYLLVNLSLYMAQCHLAQKYSVNKQMCQ